MQSIFLNYRGASKSIGSDHLQGYGTMVEGVSYEIAPTKELQRVSNKLRKQLDLSKEKISNEVTRLNKLNEKKNGFSFNYTGDMQQNYIIYTKNETSR
jgi:hypothetical protein